MDEKYPVHLFEYEHDGHTWVLEIRARSREDAEARLNRLPFARYSGELVARIPAQLGWIARLLCWAKNTA